MDRAGTNGQREPRHDVVPVLLVGQPAINAAFPEAGSRSAGRRSIPGLFVT